MIVNNKNDIMGYFVRRCNSTLLAKNVMVYTLLFGLAAHLYAFVNFTLSHDSLLSIHSDDDVKIQLGRFGVAIYKYITSSFVSLPWTSGILALLFIMASNILICRIFRLDKIYQIMLVSGMLVTNLTITSLIATYIHDLGADTFSLLMAAVAAYAWNHIYRESSGKLLYALIGILSMVVSLSLYQAYLSVTAVIILFVLLWDLLRGEGVLNIIKSGFFAMLYMIISCMIYLPLTDVACKVSGWPKMTDSYNSISNMTNTSISFLSRIYTAYYNVYNALIKNPITTFRYPLVGVANICLLCFLAIFFLRKWWKIGLGEKVLAAVLVMITPFIMNISGFLNGMSHDLMIYAVWLIYIPILILVSEEKSVGNNLWKGKVSVAAMALIGLLIVQNIQTANTVYLKKDVERQATISRVTSILSMIEQQEGYVYGETPVALLGHPLSGEERVLQEGNIAELTGSGGEQITYSLVWNSYLANVLSYRMNLCAVGQVHELQARQEVIEMPCFPSNGAVRVIDGIIVVKLSNDSYY